jgi:hypothetical protein
MIAAISTISCCELNFPVVNVVELNTKGFAEGETVKHATAALFTKLADLRHIESLAMSERALALP